MAKMNPAICRQWEAVKDTGTLQHDFFRDKGIAPASGKAYLAKWRRRRNEA